MEISKRDRKTDAFKVTCLDGEIIYYETDRLTGRGSFGDRENGVWVSDTRFIPFAQIREIQRVDAKVEERTIVEDSKE